MKRHQFFTYKDGLIIFISSIMVVSCTTTKPGNTQSGLTTSKTPNANYQSSTIIFTTMEEIVNWAEIIVMAEPVAEKEIVNTARDSNDISQPHSEFYGIGQVYEILISQYYKGEGPMSLNVIQNHGIIKLSSPDHILTEDEIEQVMQQENIIPLTINQSYILFLKPASEAFVNLPSTYYFGNVGPWRFEITDSDCVQPEDETTDIYIYFPAVPLDEFIQYINNPTLFQEVPYPAPLIPERCPVGIIETTLYP